ncbi:MAG: hypothetical protein GXO26_07620 [Crenarchaeota archaeon]|nr:hypothetical protein [Thermoproteota archaeon]
MYIVHVDGPCLLYTSIVSVSIAEALARRSIDVALCLYNPLENSYCVDDGKHVLCVNSFPSQFSHFLISNMSVSNFHLKIIVHYPLISYESLGKISKYLNKSRETINVVPVVKGVEGCDPDNNVCIVKVKSCELCIEIDRLLMIGSKLSRSPGIEDLVEEILVRVATIQ